MSLTVDLSGLQAMLKAAQTLVTEEVPAVMQAVVDLGATYARANHGYQNRTGKLTRSTRGVWVRKTRNGVIRNLEAGAPYASYVRNRGLMSIDYAARQVEAELADRFSALVV